MATNTNHTPGPLEPDRALIGRLAEEHDAHLRYIGARFHASLNPEEREETTQQAYVKALEDIAGNPDKTFKDYDAARGWFRRILDRRAIDAVRHRDGRPSRSKKQSAEDTNQRQRTRPVELSLEAVTAGPDPEASSDADRSRILADPAADFEATLLDAAHRDHKQTAVEQAMTELSDTYRRTIRLRFFDNLDYAAIGELLGCTAEQAGHRVTHALKALRPKLAAVVGVGCPEIRLLLDQNPELLLDRYAQLNLDGHIESCEPCRAFSLQLRGALAAIPLPVAATAAQGGLLAKLAGLFGHTPTSHSAAATTAGGGTGTGAVTAASATTAVAAKAAAAVTIAALAAGGAATVSQSSTDTPPPRVSAVATPTPTPTPPPARITPVNTPPKTERKRRAKKRTARTTTAPAPVAATPTPTPQPTPTPAPAPAPAPAPTSAPAPAPAPAGAEPTSEPSTTFSDEFSP